MAPLYSRYDIRADVTVVELHRSNDVRPTYSVLSAHLDRKYRYLLRANPAVGTDDRDGVVAREAPGAYA